MLRATRTKPPRATINTPGGPTGRRIRDPGVSTVFLGSDDPVIDVYAQLTGPIEVDPPKPKIVTIDLPLQVGSTQWMGQDPYGMRIPLMFDGRPNGSVEKDIAALESLAEVASGHDEPPVVRVVGPVPKAHPNLTWRVASFSDPEPSRLAHLPDGARCWYATTVTLIQRTSDRLLTRSLGKAGKGIANRSHVVKQGEDSLYDVAKHVYGDPSRAADIARANSHRGRPLRLAQRLTVGERLRIP